MDRRLFGKLVLAAGLLAWPFKVSLARYAGSANLATHLMDLLARGVPLYLIEDEIIRLGVDPVDVLTLHSQRQLHDAVADEIDVKAEWVDCGMDGMRLVWLNELEGDLRRNLERHGIKVRDLQPARPVWRGCSR